MLEINDLSCGYGSKDVVKEISMSVHDGERLCVLGPNGCGKTTLMSALSGIIPYKGSARLYGKEIREYSRRELSGLVAMFSQLSYVQFGYTVYDTVAMGRYLKSKGRLGITTEDKKAAGEYIGRLGLSEISDKPVTELSGGQLQRVLLARAFAQEPKLLILDEPLNHLDISYQIALVELIKDWLSQDKTRTVVGVVHELNICPMLFDRAVLISEGRKTADGSVEGVLKGDELAKVYGTDVRTHMRRSLMFWE